MTPAAFEELELSKSNAETYPWRLRLHRLLLLPSLPTRIALVVSRDKVDMNIFIVLFQSVCFNIPPLILIN